MPEERKDESMVLEGIGAAIVATILAAGAMVMIGDLAPKFAGRVLPIAVVGIGLTQLIYIVPIVIAFLYFRRRKAAVGAIITAALVFLLNAACWGMVLTIRR